MDLCPIGFLVACSLSTDIEAKNPSELPQNSKFTPYAEINPIGFIFTFQRSYVFPRRSTDAGITSAPTPTSAADRLMSR